MRLLIDSHVLIWALTRPAELSTVARRTLDDPANNRFVSIASMWEIAIKVSVGKLSLPDELATGIEGMAASPLPITPVHVSRIQRLPFHHRDPFDRMLIAQALEEGLTIVTRDRQFQAYGVPILPA